MSYNHTLRCPLCAAPYPVSTLSALPPVELPCSRCWSTLEPPLRAPFLRRSRAAVPETRALAHRDPVPYAPATLQAYVRHLEDCLTRAEARLHNVEQALRIHEDAGQRAA